MVKTKIFIILFAKLPSETANKTLKQKQMINAWELSKQIKQNKEKKLGKKCQRKMHDWKMHVIKTDDWTAHWSTSYFIFYSSISITSTTITKTSSGQPENKLHASKTSGSPRTYRVTPTKNPPGDWHTVPIQPFKEGDVHRWGNQPPGQELVTPVNS